MDRQLAIAAAFDDMIHAKVVSQTVVDPCVRAAVDLVTGMMFHRIDPALMDEVLSLVEGSEEFSVYTGVVAKYDQVLARFRAQIKAYEEEI